MQPLNGVDQGHPTASALPPPIEDSGELIQLPEDLKTKLKEPLPAAAVSPNPQKLGLSAIKVIYVVERLNDVFGLNGWHMDNEVVETGRMVVVRAALAIPKYGIAIEQSEAMITPIVVTHTKALARTRCRSVPATWESAWTCTRV